MLIHSVSHTYRNTKHVWVTSLFPFQHLRKAWHSSIRATQTKTQQTSNQRQYCSSINLKTHHTPKCLYLVNSATPVLASDRAKHPGQVRPIPIFKLLTPTDRDPRRTES